MLLQHVLTIDSFLILTYTVHLHMQKILEICIIEVSWCNTTHAVSSVGNKTLKFEKCGVQYFRLI